jgi:tetratricopeptide (TPR) repeat protein
VLVQRAHHSVDEYRTSDEQRSSAEARLHDPGSTERALRQAIAEAPDAPNTRERWVIQDLYYRLAQLLTDTGAMDRAALEIQRGLVVDAAPTLARANLLALQGKILEKQGQLEAAAKAYHAALLVNEVLMDQALSGSTEQGSGPP